MLAKDTVDALGFRCLVFDLGGPSLRDIIAQKDLQPMPVRHIREISFQIFHGLICTFSFPEIALCCLTHLPVLHNNGIAHTDIKPDNIILLNGDIMTFSVFSGGKLGTVEKVNVVSLHRRAWTYFSNSVF